MTNRDSVTFGAVGDIALYGNVASQVEKAGIDWPFEMMRSELNRADVLFGNLECVAIPDDYPRKELDPSGLVTLLPGELVGSGLRRAGFDVLNLAQNHVLDAGSVGMEHTQRAMEAAGLKTGGVGATQDAARKLTVVEHGGLRLGFLCYCEDSNYTLGTRGPCYAYYTSDAVLEDIACHRTEVDILVVSVHADIEFMPTPSVPRLAAFREFARAGAHIVLGHHPHVPQGCEIVDGCLIAYSLGNFVFPAKSSDYMRRHLPRTARSFLLLAEVDKQGVRSFQRIAFEIGGEDNERPVPLEADAKGEIDDYLARLDAHLDDDDFVRSTWRNVARRQLSNYVKQVVKLRPPRGSRWRRMLHAALRRVYTPEVQVDMDRVVDELVGRLCLTAENRAWMEEILAAGSERWEQRNSEPRDPLHRPHYRFS